MERASRLPLGLAAPSASLLLGFGAIIMVKRAFWTQKHCDNTAANSNTGNARSRMVASSRGKRGYGDKGRCVKYWVRLGLLDFTMLRPVLAWRAFWNLWTIYFFNFPFFFGPR
jgi:hypothetical protein